MAVSLLHALCSPSCSLCCWIVALIYLDPSGTNVCWWQLLAEKAPHKKSQWQKFSDSRKRELMCGCSRGEWRLKTLYMTFRPDFAAVWEWGRVITVAVTVDIRVWVAESNLTFKFYNKTNSKFNFIVAWPFTPLWKAPIKVLSYSISCQYPIKNDFVTQEGMIKDKITIRAPERLQWDFIFLKNFCVTYIIWSFVLSFANY